MKEIGQALQRHLTAQEGDQKACQRIECSLKHLTDKCRIARSTMGNVVSYCEPEEVCLLSGIPCASLCHMNSMESFLLTLCVVAGSGLLDMIGSAAEGGHARMAALTLLEYATTPG